MAKLLGTNATFCLNTGDTDAPEDHEWTPLIAARDIKAMRSPGASFDSSDRASLFQSKIPTRHAPVVSFDFLWNGGAGTTALRDAYVAGTPLLGAYLLGEPADGQKGMCGEWAVSKFPLEFPLLDGQKVQVELKPHGNATLPFDINYTDPTLAAGTPETPVARKLGTNAGCFDAANALITAFTDIKLILESGGEFDSSDRTLHLSTDAASYYIQSIIPTRKNVYVETKFLQRDTSTQLAAIKTILLSGGMVTMRVLDGPYATAGSWGVFADWGVEQWDEDALLLGGQEVTLKMCIHGNATNTGAFITIGA